MNKWIIEIYKDSVYMRMTYCANLSECIEYILRDNASVMLSANSYGGYTVIGDLYQYDITDIDTIS